MQFGGRREFDLRHLTRTAKVNEGEPTHAHAPTAPGMRFGGRDETAAHQIVTRVDHLEGRLPEHILENLAPRIAEHSRIAQETDRVPFLYYQKLKFGRLCSCWSAVSSQPDKRCPVCYGYAFVGGFKKYGCDWNVIDTTYPSLTLVNVAPDFDGGKLPVPMALLPTATLGYIEAEVQLGANTGVLDAMRLGSFAPRGSKVTFYARTTSESTFTEVTRAHHIESRLVNSLGNPNTLVLRFELRRTDDNAPCPTMTYLHLRHRTRDDIRVVVDIAPQAESIEAREHGLEETFDTIDFAISNILLPNVGTGDMFIRVDNDPNRDGQRFKATTVTPWTPFGVQVESVVRARNISPEERWRAVL